MKTFLTLSVLLFLTSGCVRLVQHIYPKQETICNTNVCDSMRPRLKWKFKPRADGGFFSGPTVYNGVVYATDVDNRLYALDENSGALKWSFNIRGIVNEVRSGPKVSHGMVFFWQSGSSIRHRCHYGQKALEV